MEFKCPHCHLFVLRSVADGVGKCPECRQPVIWSERHAQWLKEPSTTTEEDIYTVSAAFGDAIDILSESGLLEDHQQAYHKLAQYLDDRYVGYPWEHYSRYNFVEHPLDYFVENV